MFPWLLSTSCRGGADVAQVQALLGHASLDTAARYFRAGSTEQAAVVEAIFDK
jgi:site-specific recombinase XerD